MSKADSTIEAAKAVQATKAEGALRNAAADALKRARLPEDLIERTKTLQGTPFAHRETFAKLPDGDRVNLRKAFKNFADFPVGEFDRLTGAGAGDGGDGRAGRPVEWDDPDPWPEAVSGAAVLTDIAGFIRRHVSLPDELADTVALWVPVTWIHARLEISPFLNLTSATKRCGKSLLLEVLGEFVYRPLPVGGRITSAALFRTIGQYAPTLLLDEADTYLRDDDELRGVVNGSQRRSTAYVLRCVGDDYEPRQFVTWCPKAIAGIGAVPDTVLDRSIVLRLERRPPNVALASWRDRDKGAVETLRRKLARWIADNEASIVAGLSAVEFPSGLHDRARDAWEALLAIGNAAGGEWAGPGGRAWRACQRVMASTAGEETGACETLLADLHAIFEAKGWPEALGSKAILNELGVMEGRSWGEWSKGKPMTGHALARLLKPFGIATRNHRFPDGSQSKAYFAAELQPAWEAYLPEAGGFEASQRPNPGNHGVSEDLNPSRSDLPGTDADRTTPRQTRDWDVGTLRNRGTRGNGAESTPAPVSLPSQPPGAERAVDACCRRRRSAHKWRTAGGWKHKM